MKKSALRFVLICRDGMKKSPSRKWQIFEKYKKKQNRDIFTKVKILDLESHDEAYR